MRTIQDLYNDIVSTEHGRKMWAEARARIIAIIAEDAEYPEKVPATFASLIGRLQRKKPYPHSNLFAVAYIGTNTDGDNRLCIPIFDREDIADFGLIKPWECVNTEYGAELAEGETSLWDMDDNTIIVKLSCLRLLPSPYKYEESSIHEVLGAFVFTGNIPDIFVLEYLLLDVMYTKVHGYGIWNSPLEFVDDYKIPMPTKLAEDCDYLDEDHRDPCSVYIRKTQLLSFVSLYNAIKEARIMSQMNLD